MYLVYQITNTVDGKRYVGMTKRGMDVRWKQHVKVAFGKPVHGRTAYLRHAIKAHGPEAFVCDVLFREETLRGAQETEILTILDRAPEYNMTLGGEGTHGHVHTEAARKKMSEKRRLRVTKDETRALMSKAHTGRKHSEETKQKIGAGNRGKTLSPAHRAAVAESNRRRAAAKRNQTILEGA